MHFPIWYTVSIKKRKREGFIAEKKTGYVITSECIHYSRSIVPAYAATPEMALTTETEASVLTDEIELPESIMGESEENATKTAEESVVEETTKEQETAAPAEDSAETPATDILTNVAPSEESSVTDETANKPEARNMISVTVGNIHLTCLKLTDTTVRVNYVSPVQGEDATTVVIPATVTFDGVEYAVTEVSSLGGVNWTAKNIELSEGIVAFTPYDTMSYNFETLTLPSTLKQVTMQSVLPDGTNYMSIMKNETEKWVQNVIIPDSNPYLKFDTEKNGIFLKDEVSRQMKNMQ